MNNLRSVFKRSMTAVAVTVSLGLAVPAFAASNNSGSIYGKAEAGSKITYKNTSTGVARTIGVDSQGRFNISSVPAGKYTVTDINGMTRDIRVVIGTGSNVNFSEVEVIQINGMAFTTIDTSSAESTSVFTADDIAALPLPRDSVSVALLTPGAIQGGSNFDRNLPSFGGSSIGENGYYIDGMDVTNLRSMLSFAKLPQDAISQTQVKSGGYGVEYGRALGGIINIVTKSGTNDWEFGGSVYTKPSALKATAKDTYDYDQDRISAYNSSDEYSTLKYNVYGGGPLIEDTLFFYTNIEGQKTQSDQFSRTTSYESSVTTPNYLAKIDWYVNEDHLLRLTHINNETEYDRANYDNVDGVYYSTEHGEQSSAYKYSSGGSINVLSYTGYMTDDVTLNLMYGQLKNRYLKVPNLQGDDCPYAWDTTGGVGWGGRESIGCWAAPVQSTVKDSVDDEDVRTSYKIDVSWVLGDHTVRFGYNSELYESTVPGSLYSGDIYYRYRTSDADGNGNRINGVDLAQGTEVVRVRGKDEKTATFDVENTAWYLENTWQVSDELMVYGGLRGETFTNRAGNGGVFVKSDNLIAPRIGFAWDVEGDSTKKVYGTLGQYYIPVASNMNINTTSEKSSYEDHHYVHPVNGKLWDENGAPLNLGDKFGASKESSQVPNPAIIADKNLEPMSQLELILGYQQEYNDEWTLGAKFMARTVVNGMDDFCAHDGFSNWAAENGHTDFDVTSMNKCMIINPGKDITLAMDLNDDGEYVDTTVPAEYFGLPEYKRHYLGLEFTAEKALTDNWTANFSYVLSRTFGNAEGYVNSALAQEDAGATQDFDHANLMHGGYGDLPTDRTHQLKAYGLYQLNDEITLSLNVSAVSGSPLSCLGYVSKDGTLKGKPGSGTDSSSDYYDYNRLGNYAASSFYCLNDDGETELGKRGQVGRTNWLFTTAAGVSYRPIWADGLTLKATVSNLFNTQRPTDYSQTKDYEENNPKINPNYRKATGYQSPRAVTLSASYKF